MSASPTPPTDNKPNYKQTLNLPATAFPMKANLVQNEPATLKRWAGLAGGKGLYAAQRARAAGRPTFAFHDGPPYANGSIHLGHLMNKCLKDFVTRSQFAMGRDCPFVPGWDCHGLPIEHKVMTDLVEAGKAAKLDTLEPDQRRMAVRRECKAYADKQIKLQAGQMQRLLTVADYEDPYLTMDPAYEAAVLEVLADLCAQGLVAKALKPVHWSVENETALADAELEYQDREDLSVFVDFEAADAQAVYAAFGLDEDAQEAHNLGQTPSFMIWTTTPWTLPANVAVAVNPKAEYALVRMDGNLTVLAADLVQKVAKAGKAEEVASIATVFGDRLVGLRYKHPFVDPARGEGSGADNIFRIVAAEYVTLEDGTGLVHTAPGHGAEDYQTGLRESLPVYCPVRADGTYDGTVPAEYRGVRIWDANQRIADMLRTSGHLFHMERFTHSYPHDWRSKTPVIFRATEQWFVTVDKPYRLPTEPTTWRPESLKTRALCAAGPNEGPSLRRRILDMTAQIESMDTTDDDKLEPAPDRPADQRRFLFSDPDLQVRFIPAWGQNRMSGMLESRPDWCISRQRAWGLPIPAFVLPDGSAFMTAAGVRAVSAVVRTKGSDAWFTMAPAELLAGYDAPSDADAPEALRSGAVSLADLKKGHDILDVWFESGSSWNAVMRRRFGEAAFPVELYLEGSDQHRGWFQLSLLPSLGATGRAPFRTILTHGFMVDKDGKKLSKSKGATIADLFDRYGADVLRWWVASLAYENDVKVDEEFFKGAGESYRKVRNTLRFLLSNLSDFTPELDADGALKLGDVPPASIEAWVLGEYDTLRAQVVGAFEKYQFHAAHKALYNFCNTTLSAVYLAAVKDRLYCDEPGSERRRRTQRAMWFLADGLCRLLAPVLSHTADEAWRSLRGEDPDACVHLETFGPASGVRADDGWASVFGIAEDARKRLEDAKASTGIENPLDAGLVLPDERGVLARLDPTDLADLLGVSRVSLGTPMAVQDLRAEPRCERSWKRDGTVRQRSDGGVLSDRDARAVGVA